MLNSVCGVFEGTPCIQQNQSFCRKAFAALGLMQPWRNKCFAVPFADIIIIAHLYLYIFCSAFAEQQGSAMLKMVHMHTEKGSWESYIAQVLPDILSYVPQTPAAGCFMAICRVAPALWIQGKDTASCSPSEGPAAYYGCPTRATESLRCQHPHRWRSPCLPAAIILTAWLEQALQQLAHWVLLMCTGAFPSTQVI